MKISITNLILIILSLLLVCILCVLIFHHQAYEYKLVQPNDYTIESDLNQYGSQGCHIASSRRALDGLKANYEIIMECPRK